jgi:prepilin-type N-terminal cleavage/methylation domain-containing protein/prepilin-type processing-associated H-X9-DG protein
MRMSSEPILVRRNAPGGRSAIMRHLIVSINRRGFTLIELVVVMAILGVLTALLLPAVQQARGAAARIHCTNNLKQLGLGLHLYHDTAGSFPPAFMNYGPYGNTGFRFTHGWAPFILPEIEQRALYDLYHWEVPLYHPLNQPVVATHVAIFRCPSAPSNRISTMPPFALFGAQGACGDYANSLGIDPALGAGDVRGVLAEQMPARMADITDGTSNTTLLTECGGRPQLWLAGRGGTEQVVEGGPWAGFKNGVTLLGTTHNGATRPGPCAINCTNLSEVYSFHSGGANAVFADGHVRFLSASIDIHTFAALVTRAGGEVPGDF